ncbi:Zinc metalloproteinase nas-15 [Exaiptasia diaphana]|nr:Zinc metalloproteinase nas-15 [Exaiptasia diaphana]
MKPLFLVHPSELGIGLLRHFSTNDLGKKMKTKYFEKLVLINLDPTVFFQGVYHEQSRPDRDRYVEILWHNIQPGKEKNFRKYGHGQLDKLGLPYDTSSIMHYDRYLFSKSQKPTIVARGRPWIKLGGQLRGSMTSNDAREVNSLFNC